MFSTFRKPAFVKLYAVTLVSMITMHMTWSIAVLYALDLGADILQVNLITAIQSLMSIILVVPIGVLSDRFGRKPLLLYPTVIMILGTLIRAFATKPSHLIVASFAAGFASFFPTILSMIADVTQPEEQQEAISTMFLFSSIGMLIGPALCSFLLTLPQITLRNIYQIVFFALIGIVLYIAISIKETKPNTRKGPKIAYKDYVVDVMRETSFKSLLLIGFLYFLQFNIIGTYIPIYARVDLDLSDAEIASFFTYRNLAVMLIRFPSATFLTNVAIRPFLFSALVLAGISGLALPFTVNYVSLVLVLFLSGVSFGAFRILTSTLVAKNSSQKNRGVANSLFNVAMSTGSITKIFTSPIANSLGLASVFIIGGISALIATIPTLLHKLDKQNSV